MSLRRETVNFSIITGITVLGGFTFHILLGRRFGITWQLDCFFIALTLYSWASVFNTFITRLYIPIFNEVKSKSNTEALLFADVALKWTVLLAALIVVLVFFFHKSILSILAPGFDRKMVVLASQLIRLVIFSLLFFSMSNIMLLTLNALYAYTVPALLDLLDPLLNIAALFFLVPVYGIVGIAFSYLVSNAAKALFLAGYLHWKTGWKPTGKFYHEKLPELFRKSTKMALSGFIWSLRDVITRNIASRLGEGAVSLYSYAEKIIVTLVQIMINPLAKVYYSRVSEWLAFKRFEDIKALFVRTARASFFLNVFACAGLAIFLSPFLRLFLLGSKFSPAAIQSLDVLFKVMLVYLLIVSLENYFSLVVFASQRAGVVAVNATMGIVILFFGGNYLAKQMGILGLAWAVVATQFFVCILYYLFTRKYLGVNFLSLAGKLARTLVIGAIFLLAGIGVKSLLIPDGAMLLVILPLWSVIYVLTANIFQKEELKILLERKNK